MIGGVYDGRGKNVCTVSLGNNPLSGSGCFEGV